MFIMPAKGRITSPFGMRTHPIYKDKRMHQGIDVGNHADNTIVAAAVGKVRLVVTNNPKKGYGHYLIITHSNGYETLYAHLKSVAVKVGQTVKQGQRIGVKGTTGASTGVHLHFEVHAGRWNNKWSNAKNPMNYIIDPSAKLTVDGYLGKATISAEQRHHGTPVDGVISKPSAMIRRRQAVLGVKQDGYEGPITIKAEQKRYGTPQDGKISRPSAMIKERQRRLNNGKL